MQEFRKRTGGGKRSLNSLREHLFFMGKHMQFRYLRFWSCCLAILAGMSLPRSGRCLPRVWADDPVGSETVEIDLRKMRVPSASDRKLIREWILDLQTKSMMFDRLAVDVTGEKFIGARVEKTDTIVARRFAFTWVIDQLGARERLVFADQSLLHSAKRQVDGVFLVDSNASAYDQLKLGDLYYGASGKQIHQPSKNRSLNARFRRCGVFDPVCATTAGAVSIITGKVFDRNLIQLHLKNLIGIYRKADLTIAAFEYRPAQDLIFLRVAVFRNAVPVQVDDHVSLGSDRLQLAELGDKRGNDELLALHKLLTLHARNRSTWANFEDVPLPVAMHAMTVGGEQDFEVRANFKWTLKASIPETVFALETVGVASPLTVWASGDRE